MQLKISIHQGQARLLNPVYLKPDAPSIYSIDIPDDMVAPSRDWFSQEVREQINHFKKPTQVPEAAPGSLQARLNKILGNMAKVRPAASIGEDEQMLKDALEERYFGR